MTTKTKELIAEASIDDQELKDARKAQLEREKAEKDPLPSNTFDLDNLFRIKGKQGLYTFGSMINKSGMVRMYRLMMKEAHTVHKDNLESFRRCDDWNHSPFMIDNIHRHCRAGESLPDDVRKLSKEDLIKFSSILAPESPMIPIQKIDKLVKYYAELSQYIDEPIEDK